MSILKDELQGLTVRTLWKGPDVELVVLAKQDARGLLCDQQFEVHIPGEPVLYRSTSRSAAVHYLGMLLGMPEYFQAGKGSGGLGYLGY